MRKLSRLTAVTRAKLISVGKSDFEFSMNQFVNPNVSKLILLNPIIILKKLFKN